MWHMTIMISKWYKIQQSIDRVLFHPSINESVRMHVWSAFLENSFTSEFSHNVERTQLRTCASTCQITSPCNTCSATVQVFLDHCVNRQTSKTKMNEVKATTVSASTNTLWWKWHKQTNKGNPVQQHVSVSSSCMTENWFDCVTLEFSSLWISNMTLLAKSLCNDIGWTCAVGKKLANDNIFFTCIGRQDFSEPSTAKQTLTAWWTLKWRQCWDCLAGLSSHDACFSHMRATFVQVSVHVLNLVKHVQLDCDVQSGTLGFVKRMMLLWTEKMRL